MKTVKALSTTAGEYGRREKGDVFEVTDSLARQLVAKGIVEETDEDVTEKPAELSAEDQAAGKTAGKTAEDVEQPKEKRVTGGVNIADNTGKEKQQVNTPATPSKTGKKGE